MTRLGYAKIAASTVALGAMLTVSNPATGEQVKKPAVEAAKYAAAAEKATAKQRHQDAVADAERAVALMPQEPRYRLLLGQTYLSAGRFASAEAAFSDTLTLTPGDSKAAISLALAQVALGKKDAARETLGAHADAIGATDQGLALALAGDPEAAVGILLPAARNPANGPRARQNLALAYAMAGRWQEAKLMASLDVSPSELPRRMGEWAMLVQAASPMQQVATLLGVTPAQDPGHPAQLALAPQADEPVMMAEAEAAPPPPVRISEAAFNTVQPAPAPVEEPKADLSEFVDVQPAERPALVRPAAEKPIQWAAMRAEAPRAIRKPGAARLIQAAKLVDDGNFVVQLGAYSAPERLERAWDIAVSQAAGLADFTPSSTTFIQQAGGRTLYRLSVGGFATRGDAARVCAQLKARGSECFVRATAGDAIPQWALKWKRGQQLASR